MSRFSPGQVVELQGSSISSSGETTVTLAAGLKGRVCRTMSQFCCVRFAELGCRRVRESRLILSSGNPPGCDVACTKRC